MRLTRPTFECSGGGLVVGEDLLELAAGLRHKQQEMVLGVTAEDLLGSFLSKFHSEREGVGRDVSLDGVDAEALHGQVVATLVELLEENDSVT